MNSLAVYSLFLLLPVYVVCASDYNVYILKTPYNFKFKVNDVLNMDIAMLNIPPNVYYFSVNSGEKSLINKFEISRWDIWHIIIDTIATQNSYHSIQLLLYEKYDSNNACTTVNIAQGQPKNSLRSISEQDETDDCLNDKHCTIAVDFRNSCTKTVPYFKCSTIDPLVICTKHEYEEATFTWHQFYDDGSYIGTTPEIKATISSFIYTLQNFDNNTFVKALSGNSRSNTLKMNNVIPEYKTESKLTFNDSTTIEFDCETYLQQTKYVYVGLINTTENKITTLNTTKINKKYGAEYNGSILCCLYYTTQKISEKIPEINVIRHVQDTTLLLYSTATPEPLPYFNCSSFDRVVMCSKQEYKEATFTWQQFYDDGSYIGTIPEIKATISSFIYTLQNFDNNTFVKALPGNFRSNTIKMKPVITEYKTESKLTFNDSTDIEFDCETYLQQTKYAYVGLINTTENKIRTLNTTKINKKYGAEYNGSILCCLYYTTQKISEKIPEINVIRHVQDTTLLLYSTATPELLPYFNCSSIDRLIVCTKQEHKEATFTWLQLYDDGSYIGTTPEIKVTISTFIFAVEYFDNNTFVKVLPGKSISNKIIVDPDFIPEYRTESKLTFNDSTNIEFDCEIYLQQTKYVYVGLINTTENKITTLNTTKI
ncbi:uncharacterized protein LOC110381868 isoform X1 [Helicoverpa armigera]|uniref:uncharacterized protein LOC110381868 isoform X1 n=1 Tax=Helicoverpa armigera TaxID=29058 RepID=UPI003082C17C